ncbi:MAG: DUF1810 domain-containing protein, partial [bacterium]
MDIITEIEKLDLPAKEYVVLGSGILGALGIRDIADVDLLVSPSLFDELRERGWAHSTLDYEGIVRHKLTFGIAEAFADFWYGDQHPDPATLIAKAEMIKGFPFLPLAELLKIKRVLNRPKDQLDITLIGTYLARQESRHSETEQMNRVDQGLALANRRSTASVARGDPFDLARFTTAQEGVYDRALTELRCGQKRTHWMWYIFPQIDGLGHSDTSKRFAIKSVDEARQYLGHPLLGPRLLKCAKVILAIKELSATEVFGFPDDVKLRSSMTLFAHISVPDSVFVRVLDKYFNGQQDAATLHLLDELDKKR